MSDFPQELHPDYRCLEKIKNTFLQAHWLWPMIVNSEHHAKQLTRSPQRLLEKLRNRLPRVFWFWPRITDARIWAEASIGSRYDPQNYVELQPSSHVLIDEVVSRASGPDAPILDLGCNCGRHLNALVNHGFTALYGVDIGRAALDYMNEAFPGLRSRVHVSYATFQQFLPQTPDQFFEIVFTHGATVELVHPSFPLVKDLARVAKEQVFLVINENGHSYPRFWTYEFQRSGFVLVKLLRPCAENTSSSLLVYGRYL